MKRNSPTTDAPLKRKIAGPARILVVDDQPANLQILGTVLGKLGYEIIPASDGPTALKRLALRPPDLILLDLLMPEMDGCEVCRRVRANPEWQDIPVIFLSAADEKDFIVRALDSGGVDYITKPFNQAELSSRVRTQLALKSARDQLKQLVEDKDELLGILTHDLKNHLIGLQMSADLLRDRRRSLDDASITRLCENISRSGGQLLDFVKEFLANAAAENGHAPKLEEVNLAAAVARAGEDFQEAARRKNLSLRVCLPGQSIPVQANHAALSHVLDNLLSNAIKFSPPNKEIIVTVRPGANFGECIIQDQGPGFTAEDKARMFHRYARLSARPTANEPSSGLGLSIARKLVQAMNGELKCDSVPGQGATFTVRLPHPPLFLVGNEVQDTLSSSKLDRLKNTTPPKTTSKPSAV